MIKLLRPPGNAVVYTARLKHMEPIGIPIPELLWTDLESALQMQIKALANDIAGTLGQPAGPLLDALRGGLLKIYSVPDTDDTELDARCAYMCPMPDQPAFIGACGQPIAWGTKACPKHLFVKPMKLPGLVMTPLVAEGAADEASDAAPTKATAVAADGTVYDGHGAPCGTYCRSSKTLYRIEPEE